MCKKNDDTKSVNNADITTTQETSIQPSTTVEPTTQKETETQATEEMTVYVQEISNSLKGIMAYSLTPNGDLIYDTYILDYDTKIYTGSYDTRTDLTQFLDYVSKDIKQGKRTKCMLVTHKNKKYVLKAHIVQD